MTTILVNFPECLVLAKGMKGFHATIIVLLRLFAFDIWSHSRSWPFVGHYFHNHLLSFLVSGRYPFIVCFQSFFLGDCLQANNLVSICLPKVATISNLVPQTRCCLAQGIEHVQLFLCQSHHVSQESFIVHIRKGLAKFEEKAFDSVLDFLDGFNGAHH